MCAALQQCYCLVCVVCQGEGVPWEWFLSGVNQLFFAARSVKADFFMFTISIPHSSLEYRQESTWCRATAAERPISVVTGF